MICNTQPPGLVRNPERRQEFHTWIRTPLKYQQWNEVVDELAELKKIDRSTVPLQTSCFTLVDVPNVVYFEYLPATTLGARISEV